MFNHSIDYSLLYPPLYYLNMQLIKFFICFHQIHISNVVNLSIYSLAMSVTNSACGSPVMNSELVLQKALYPLNYHRNSYDGNGSLVSTDNRMMLSSNATAKPEITRRFWEAKAGYKALAQCWSHTDIQRSRKVESYAAVLFPSSCAILIPCGCAKQTCIG